MKSVTLSSIEEIRALLRDVGDRLLRAGQLYAKEIDINPDFRQLMRDEFPTLTGAFLRDLEFVGRGSLDAQALELGLSCGSKLRRLPLSEQRDLIQNGVEIWTGKDTRTVPLSECGPALLAQVIAKDRVRTPSEQAAWHEEQNAKRRDELAGTHEKKLADGTTLVYKLDKAKRRLRIIHPPCFISAKELSVFLAELT
jgi:hypothetical protein